RVPSGAVGSQHAADQGWSLTDALAEMIFARPDVYTALAPRKAKAKATSKKEAASKAAAPPDFAAPSLPTAEEALLRESPDLDDRFESGKSVSAGVHSPTHQAVAHPDSELLLPAASLAVLPVASGPVSFNARDCPHEVLPSQGLRVVLAAYYVRRREEGVHGRRRSHVDPLFLLGTTILPDEQRSKYIKGAHRATFLQCRDLEQGVCFWPHPHTGAGKAATRPSTTSSRAGASRWGCGQRRERGRTACSGTPQNYNVGILRARRRRQQPGPRLPPVPQHNFGELYYAPTRRTVHLYRNCVGLASVRPMPSDIITENLCLTCWGGMIIGPKKLDAMECFARRKWSIAVLGCYTVLGFVGFLGSSLPSLSVWLFWWVGACFSESQRRCALMSFSVPTEIEMHHFALRSREEFAERRGWVIQADGHDVEVEFRLRDDINSACAAPQRIRRFVPRCGGERGQSVSDEGVTEKGGIDVARGWETALPWSERKALYEKPPGFSRKHFLTAVAEVNLVTPEDVYLLEWIDFHLLVGFDHFVI
ncbi:unnamed protein product, partial [Symbiodinium sp. CCMP2456]